MIIIEDSLGSFSSSSRAALMVASSACLSCDTLSRTDENAWSGRDWWEIVKESLESCMLKLGRRANTSVAARESHTECYIVHTVGVSITVRYGGLPYGAPCMIRAQASTPW